MGNERATSRTAAALAVWCLAMVLMPVPAWAQAESLADPSEEARLDLQKMSRLTPLGAARGFMRAAEQGDFDTASEYLDLRYLPDELANADGGRLAEQLYIVLSRKLRIDFDSLSDASDGVRDDDLPEYRDLLGVIETPRGKRTLYLQHVPGAEGGSVWKVSNATVAVIPDLYAQFGYSPFVETIRAHLPSVTFLGAELFKWVIAILAGLSAVFLWLIFAWPLSLILRRTAGDNLQRVRRYLTRPVPAAIFLLVGYMVLGNLGLGLRASQISEGKTVVTLVSVWLLFATVDLFMDLYARYLRARGRESGVMLLGPISSTSKILIAILALVVWLDNIGVNVTGLLAGLGIGGLAVALVLQRPLEDVLGAMTLFMQQPVSVGQMCTSGDVTGTIEAIGLRATRIRKLNNHLVVIPNSVFATASLENVSARRRILHRQIIRVALDTTEEKIEQTLEGLREMLSSEEGVVLGESRVKFIEFGEFSINLEIFAQIGTTDWQEFLTVSEHINLGAVRVLEEVGVQLAIPPR